MPRLSSFLFFLLSLCSAFNSRLLSATIDIVGLSPKEEEELISLIKPRLEFTLALPATESRADDAAFLVQNLLTRRGFFQAKTSWRINAANNSILVDVNKGPRYRLGKVTLKGAERFAEDDLEEYFYQPIIEREFVNKEDAPYVEGYPAEATLNIQNFLQSKGYWNAVATLESEKFNDDGSVDFIISIQAGTQHRLDRIEISSTPTALDLAPLRQLLNEFQKKTADAETIKQIRPKVVDYVRQAGYEFAKIKIEALHQQSSTTLKVDLDPGQIFSVGRPYITGLERTKNRRFARPFRHFLGQRYNGEKIDEAVRKLLATGAFESVIVTPKPREQSVLDLDIEVREAKARGYNYYGGIGSVEGIVVGAGYYDRNFMGSLYNLSAKMEFSLLGVLAEVSLVDPFFAGENIRFDTRGYIERFDFDEYLKSELGGRAEWSYLFTKHYTASLYSQLSITDISSVGLPTSELGQETYLALSFGMAHKLDYRDNPALPTKGFIATGNAELTEILGTEATTEFFKSEVSASYYYPISSKQRLSVGARGGVIIPFGESLEIPIDERFFLGGPDSIRSFAWRDLGPRPVNSDINQSVGGEAYWVLHAEYQRKIAGPLAVVAFSDVGKLAREVGDLSATDMEVAAGLGIRLDLPVGPIRLEYAKNLTQDEGEPAGSWNFAIGVAF